MYKAKGLNQNAQTCFCHHHNYKKNLESKENIVDFT